LQLQDSCREARSEATEVRQENMQLKHAGREREKFWRALWLTRKGSESQLDEFPLAFVFRSYASTNYRRQLPSSARRRTLR